MEQHNPAIEEALVFLDNTLDERDQQVLACLEEHLERWYFEKVPSMTNTRAYAEARREIRRVRDYFREQRLHEILTFGRLHARGLDKPDGSGTES